MDLSNLKYSPGSRKNKKRIGRGPGSGSGKTSGRGHKGYGSRSGSKKRAWFEGGQMPLQRRVPKFGFYNRFRVEYSVVNVGQIEKLEGIEEINPEILKDNGLIRNFTKPVKILGNGDLTKKMVIKAHMFSKSAIEKIEKAGGSATSL